MAACEARSAMLCVAVELSEAGAGAHHTRRIDCDLQRRDKLRRRARAQEKLRSNIGDKMWLLLQDAEQNFRRFLKQCSVISQEKVSTFPDTVLVSLDFEYSWRKLSRKNPRRGYYISQAGVAHVKVRDLARTSRAPDSRLDDIIKTQLFNKGHWGDASKKLRFGDCTPIGEDDIKHLLTEVFQEIALQTGRDRPSNMILVGHEISNELRIMASLGLDMSEIIALAGIIDTAKISKAMFDETDSLFGFCKKLNILSDAYKHWFHNAGNDANLTMRVLLMLAAKSIDQTVLESAERLTSHRLRAIAMEAIPPALGPPRAESEDWEAALGELPVLAEFPD